MNRTTEIDLWIAMNGATANVTAYHAMVTGHTGIVHSLARHYRRDETDVPELIGEGYMALCDAVGKAAPRYLGREHSGRFSTVAHKRVNGAMADYCYRRNGQVTSTEHQGKSRAFAKRVYEEISQRLGRAPSLSEFETSAKQQRSLNGRLQAKKIAHLFDESVSGQECDSASLANDVANLNATLMQNHVAVCQGIAPVDRYL